MIDPGVVLMLGRGAFYASALMLWGAALFRLRLMPGAPPLPGEALWPWVLLCGLAVSWPARVAAMGSGWGSALDPSMMWLVLEATSVGKSWLVQMLGAFGILFARYRRLPRLGVFAAALVLAAQAMSGHAAASPGWVGVLRQGNDVLHLWAAGAWLGALPFVLRMMRRTDAAQPRKVLIRYSREGHIWVALVLLTGMIATLMTVGALPLRWSVPYQALLSLKILVTLFMVGLALRNRYGLVPHLSQDPATRRAFTRNTGGEIALGGIAISLVAVFGMFDPR